MSTHEAGENTVSYKGGLNYIIFIKNEICTNNKIDFALTINK